MIIGIIHPGSGLGDSLFSYIATRIRAADLGVDFGFVGKEFFKGASFMNLDWGKDTNIPYGITDPSGKLVITNMDYKEFEINKPYYDPEFNFIPDGSVIDGYGAQDIRYFEHRLDEVREWLKVEPLDMRDDLVIVNFRGGEYKLFPELFLNKKYWSNAVRLVQGDNKYKSFEVHTDDPVTAKEFFNHWEIVQDIALNWRSIRYAKHVILSNSAFGILPALLNENAKDIYAPRGWANHNANDGIWNRPQNYYKKFIYI